MRAKNFHTSDAVEYIATKYPDKQIYICPDMTGNARKTSASMSDLQILVKGNNNAGMFQLVNKSGKKSNPLQRDRINCVNNGL
jgi:hypothetical protein